MSIQIRNTGECYLKIIWKNFVNTKIFAKTFRENYPGNKIFSRKLFQKRKFSQKLSRKLTFSRKRKLSRKRTFLRNEIFRNFAKNERIFLISAFRENEKRGFRFNPTFLCNQNKLLHHSFVVFFVAELGDNVFANSVVSLRFKIILLHLGSTYLWLRNSNTRLLCRGFLAKNQLWDSVLDALFIHFFSNVIGHVLD
jgi:hypothetical protein